MTSSHAQKQPLSLINPDLSGLWSSNHLGKEDDVASLLLGGIALSIFIYPWIVGMIVPFITLILFYLQQWTIAIILLSIISYPYVIKVKTWGSWQGFVIFGCNYFKGGISSSFEFEIDDTQNPLLLCTHPHGLFSLGPFYTGLRAAIGANHEFTIKEKQYFLGEYIATKPNILKRLNGWALIDTKLFNLPLFKHIIIGWLGCFVEASKKSMHKHLKRGLSGHLIPGGFNEISLLKKDVDAVYIKKRKGFIKYALKYGYTVIPGYTFGECSTYNTALTQESKLKTWLTAHRIPSVIPYGPYFWSFFLLPHRDIGLHTIYGKCKKFPKMDEPKPEDIDKYHKWYVTELERVFNDNKWRFGMMNNDLVVF